LYVGEEGRTTRRLGKRCVCHKWAVAILLASAMMTTEKIFLTAPTFPFHLPPHHTVLTLDHHEPVHVL
jgi:hypothetical protein